MPNNKSNSNERTERSGERSQWTIYFKPELELKLENYVLKIKSKKKNYSKSRMARDGMNLLIDISQKLEELGQNYDYDSVARLAIEAINFYFNEGRISKSRINNDFTQFITPLKYSLQLIKDNLNEPDKIIKIVEDAEKAINELDRRREYYFEEPPKERFIRKFNILLIEDDDFTRKTVEMHLNRKGYTIKSVKSAEEGLIELNASTPKLILLDKKLPDMQGDELCKMLKFKEEYKEYKEIPVILFSSFINKKDVEKIKVETGADEIILKRGGDIRDLEILSKYLG
ncbi:MAG: PleD family two-component system response regulator [Promethearchaeota archaeon]